MRPEISQLRRRLQLLVGAFLLGALGFLMFVVWMDRQAAPTVLISPNLDTSIAVDVRGAVSTPGVVELKPGARMIDVVEASGGTTEDADVVLINMSTYVRDGQMIVIPTRAPQEFESEQALININTASAFELTALPGIGDVYANRIVTYRTNHGPFLTVDDLLNIEGITPSLVDEIRPLITVSSGG